MAKTSKSEKAVKPNVFMRIGLFIKQIIDELRKVVTPYRQGTVLLVSWRVHLCRVADAPRTGMDFGLGKLVLWVFG